MIKKIKNADLESHTWVGQQIEPGEYYTLEALEYLKWANDDTVLSAIADGTAIINDGTIDLSGVSTQIDFLKGNDLTPKDSDGSPLSRVKITTTGWHYQLHGLEFETSKLNSLQSKKEDNSDYSFGSIKFYELINNEEVEITGENLTQAYLDLHCIKTLLDWEPTHDLEIIGGILKQKEVPSVDVRLWVVGVPDISEANGGSKPFASNINLAFIGIEEGVKVDGRTPKYLTYNSQYHTSKLRMIFRHPEGIKHKLHMIFELFKA